LSETSSRMALKVVETQSYLDHWNRVKDRQQKNMQSNLNEFLDVHIDGTISTTKSKNH
jgi:hypothetical protein